MIHVIESKKKGEEVVGDQISSPEVEGLTSATINNYEGKSNRSKQQ